MGRTTIARYGAKAEVSSAVKYLMSQIASYIKGIELIVDDSMCHGYGSFPLEEGDDVKTSAPFEGFHRDDPAQLTK